MSSSVSKIVAERNRRALLDLIMKPGNDLCADCKARAPRWASFNLGIFICVNCASIHRKIGTHITKVKSITLDEWSKEQVEVMKENGNIKSNALYNPNEARHPPPTNMVDSERDSELEKFIRSKYEFKRFIDRRPASTSQRLAASRGTGPASASQQVTRTTSPVPPLPPKARQSMPPRLHLSGNIPSLSHSAPPPGQSVSHPFPILANPDKKTGLTLPPATQPSIRKPSGQVWDDLISLQGPSQSSSLPLQYQSHSPITPMTPFSSQLQVQVQPQPLILANTPNPFTSLSLGQASATTPLVASPVSTPASGQIFPSAPLSTPALHLESTNPFKQGQLSSLTVTSPHPFSSTPATQPVMAVPTRTMLQTPSLPYATPQTCSLPFPPTSGTSFSPAGLPQHPFTPTGPTPMPLSAGTTNPFSTMPVRQASISPQPAFATTAFLGQQQQQQQQALGQTSVFGGWAGQGVQRTF